MLDGCKAVVSSPVEFVEASDSFLQEHGVRPWMGEGSMAMWIPAGPDTAGFASRSNRAAVEHGLTFRPLADTAKATLDWYLASPRGKASEPMRAGLTADRERELLALRSAGSR
ncbi:MAG: epimerase, partial [Phycisphaerales bacterium]